MIPAKPLFAMLWVLTGAALLASIWPGLSWLWWAGFGMTTSIVLLDAAFAWRPPELEILRMLPSSLPVGIPRQVRITVHNSSDLALQLEVYDHYPSTISAQGMPQYLTLEKGKTATLHYTVTPVKRGDQEFPLTQVRLLSRLGFWHRNLRIENLSRVRIYPNFSLVTKYLLLSADQHLSLMGIRKRRRRGEGQDFLQLREYREGDSLRQIDWKTTARVRKLISREYQDERDQDILFMLDCGHRMLAHDDQLSHFDHSLNALLLLTYVALRQGDAVGIGTFGGEFRWLPPMKGVSAMNTLLNSVYDLYPGSQVPDYTQAVTEVLARQRKRALIIIVTNLRDHDSSDLIPALKILKQRHLVLLTSLQEQVISEALRQKINDFDDALRIAATYDYLAHRQKSLEQIKANGILSLDVTPKELSASLVNRYLQIKSSAVL